MYARLAEHLGVTSMTVSNVGRRFAASRLDGLVDRPAMGGPKRDLVLANDEYAQLERWSRPRRARSRWRCGRRSRWPACRAIRMLG
ncbi:hypothetical protein [Arthrobacter sp. KNU40]|uniref:hypothetical protein n=1 Tax=Arthrobacter sp. KNU40 TaxID=3447965 RepID=UPI003F5EF135